MNIVGIKPLIAAIVAWDTTWADCQGDIAKAVLTRPRPNPDMGAFSSIVVFTIILGCPATFSRDKLPVGSRAFFDEGN
jgi:hypothetical protein